MSMLRSSLVEFCQSLMFNLPTIFLFIVHRLINNTTSFGYFPFENVLVDRSLHNNFIVHLYFIFLIYF